MPFTVRPGALDRIIEPFAIDEGVLRLLVIALVLRSGLPLDSDLNRHRRAVKPASQALQEPTPTGLQKLIHTDPVARHR